MWALSLKQNRLFFQGLGEVGNERKRKHVSDDFHSNSSKRTDTSTLNDATPNEKICVQAHRVVQTLLEATSTMMKLNHYEVK